MTIDELKALRAERVKALGIARVQDGETSTSFADLSKAIAEIDREIARHQAADDNRRRYRAFRMTGRKGFR